ncbi:MAG: sensor histidine kinase [Planctomycetota bacterium]
MKSILTLTAVVLVITAVCGWSYYAVIRGWLEESRRCHVKVLADSLVRSSGEALFEEDIDALDRLAGDFVLTDGIRQVEFIDSDRQVVARACRDGCDESPGVINWPLAVSETQALGRDVFALARPVVYTPGGDEPARLVGSLRMVIDTTPLAASLAEVRTTMLLIAAALIAGGLPLGGLLVWRVLVQPVRKLLSATSRLAAGDYSARVRIRRSDEIGELASALDTMADEVARSRQALLGANERLERKVRLRTGELRRVNNRLRREAAEKKDFLRAVSHDLNAPLRNVSGLVETVLRRFPSELPTEALRRLERVRANVKLAGDMLEDLLELSRMNTRPQRREPTDMYELVRGVVDAFDYEIAARGITVEMDNNMPTLCVERRRVRQAFQNLIDNAVKYINRDGDGRIEIGYGRSDGRHVFHVADNGPGLSPDERREVFRVFRRAANPVAAGVEGKGVGLALVKAVAANHDGDAWVEAAPGGGSTFYVAFCARELNAETGETHAESHEENARELVSTAGDFQQGETS